MSFHDPAPLVDNLLTFLLVRDGSNSNLLDKRLIELIRWGDLAGVVYTDSEARILQTAVKVVASAVTWFEHPAVQLLVALATSCRRNARQELKIAGLIAKGYHTKDIARELSITETMVHRHSRELYKRSQVGGRLQLGLKLAEV